jgi:hypothetical protein
MRMIPVLWVALLVAVPRAASSQSFELYGSAGPTITDPGNSVAAGVGFSPTSRLTFIASVERTRLSTQIERDRDVTSFFRGGTLLLGSGELRFTPRGLNRVGPFVLAGFAAGSSRPNVNATFPNPVKHEAGAGFVGGGLLVPINEHAAFVADVRMMSGAEGTEGIVAVAPLRAGLTWRF